MKNKLIYYLGFLPSYECKVISNPIQSKDNYIYTLKILSKTIRVFGILIKNLNMNKIIVSFDFDGTLGHKKDVQEYCKELLKNDRIQVNITTRRYSPEIGKLSKNEQPDEYWWNSIGDKNWTEVFELSDKLGIKRENITFCNMNFKVGHLKDKGYLWHLDDDYFEVLEINESKVTTGIHLKEDWVKLCNELINDNL